MCEEQHPEVPYPEVRWWTDWINDEVHERIGTMDPSPGVPGGGTTWSGVELAPY